MNNYDLNKFWLKFFEYCERPKNANCAVRLFSDESGTLYDGFDQVIFSFGSFSEGVGKFEILLDEA